MDNEQRWIVHRAWSAGRFVVNARRGMQYASIDYRGVEHGVAWLWDTSFINEVRDYWMLHNGWDWVRSGTGIRVEGPEGEKTYTSIAHLHREVPPCVFASILAAFEDSPFLEPSLADTSGASFAEAIEHLRHGRPVRRRGWSPGKHLRLDEHGRVLSFIRGELVGAPGHCPQYDDHVALDWELFIPDGDVRRTDEEVFDAVPRSVPDDDGTREYAVGWDESGERLEVFDAVPRPVPGDDVGENWIFQARVLRLEASFVERLRATRKQLSATRKLLAQLEDELLGAYRGKALEDTE